MTQSCDQKTKIVLRIMALFFWIGPVLFGLMFSIGLYYNPPDLKVTESWEYIPEEWSVFLIFLAFIFQLTFLIPYGLAFWGAWRLWRLKENLVNAITMAVLLIILLAAGLVLTGLQLQFFPPGAHVVI
jgi:hypothetical protein